MKTFKSFITENESLLDTHMKYHAAGIPLPDRDDITEYPGGKHGYPTGPNTFCIHTVEPHPAYVTASICHYKSTPKGDILHNPHGEAFQGYTDGRKLSQDGYFLDGYRVSKDEHEKMIRAYTAAGIKHEDI